MSALLDMIRARKAELEREQAALVAAETAAITDEDRVAALQRLVARARGGSKECAERLDQLRATVPAVAALIDAISATLRSGDDSGAALDRSCPSRGLALSAR
jgi:hypothetical protein